MRAIAMAVPVGFVTGMCIEFFMIKTGFYKITTDLAGRRQSEYNADMMAKSKRLLAKGIIVPFIVDEYDEEDEEENEE